MAHHLVDESAGRIAIRFWLMRFKFDNSAAGDCVVDDAGASVECHHYLVSFVAYKIDGRWNSAFGGGYCVK